MASINFAKRTFSLKILPQAALIRPPPKSSSTLTFSHSLIDGHQRTSLQTSGFELFILIEKSFSTTKSLIVKFVHQEVELPANIVKERMEEHEDFYWMCLFWNLAEFVTRQIHLITTAIIEALLFILIFLFFKEFILFHFFLSFIYFPFPFSFTFIFDNVP